MSRIRADKLANKAGTGAPQLQYGAEIPIGYGITGAGGINITGVATANKFVGDGSGLIGVASTDYIVTGTAATFNNQVNVGGVIKLGPAGVVTATTFSGNATGLTGTPAITVGNITAVDGTFSGNVSIAKTLTYEDVKNIDSVGIVTARNGLKTNVSPAITIRNGTTEKGYIGYNGNDPFIGRKDGVGLSFQNNKIRPVDGDDGSPTTNTVDIGEPTYKFKDGYFTGTLTAGSLAGDGSSLTGVISGVEVKSGGSSVGTSITAINFQSGATVTASTASGISTITISAGISTAAHVKTNGQTATLNLDTAQDHQVTCTGTVTITTTGGSVGQSHDIRIENAGSATVGLSTNFLWPSGASPSLPTASGAISLISFTVHKVGVGTQLLSGASLTYS